MAGGGLNSQLHVIVKIVRRYAIAKPWVLGDKSGHDRPTSGPIPLSKDSVMTISLFAGIPASARNAGIIAASFATILALLLAPVGTAGSEDESLDYLSQLPEALPVVVS